MRYLMDTCACIHLIRGKKTAVAAALQKLPSAQTAISAVTLAELEYGVAHSSDPGRNRLALSQFLASVDVLAFDQESAQAYGAMRQALAVKGQLIGANDLLIAAQALAGGLELVTMNLKAFKRVKGLKLMEI
jgi:tRNA(fMet)-specific endonuclease VapC